jgi:hypothetical protein
LSLLEDLARHGTSLSSARFKKLKSDLRVEAIATGDARFYVLSVLAGDIDHWLEHHDGGVPIDRTAQINELLLNRIPLIEAAPTPREGALLADELANEVGALLGGTGGWPD